MQTLVKANWLLVNPRSLFNSSRCQFVRTSMCVTQYICADHARHIVEPCVSYVYEICNIRVYRMYVNIFVYNRYFVCILCVYTNISYHELECVVHLTILGEMCVAKYTKCSTNFLTRCERKHLGGFLSQQIAIGAVQMPAFQREVVNFANSYDCIFIKRKVS